MNVYLRSCPSCHHDIIICFTAASSLIMTDLTENKPSRPAAQMIPHLPCLSHLSKLALPSHLLALWLAPCTTVTVAVCPMVAQLRRPLPHAPPLFLPGFSLCHFPALGRVRGGLLFFFSGSILLPGNMSQVPSVAASSKPEPGHWGQRIYEPWGSRRREGQTDGQIDFHDDRVWPLWLFHNGPGTDSPSPALSQGFRYPVVKSPELEPSEML